MTSKLERLDLAATARAKHRYADARQELTTLLDDFGPDPDILWGLAQIEFSLKIEEPDATDSYGLLALQHMRQAIALKSDRPEYYFTLGFLLEHVVAPDYAAAVTAYRQALQLEPNFVRALGTLAFLYGVPEDVVPLDEAISCAETAVRLAPTRSLWRVLARLYRYAGRQDQSEYATMLGLLETID